jgi:hypothetical protein
MLRPERPPPFPQRELGAVARFGLWMLRIIVLALIAMTIYSFLHGL